MQMVSLTHNPSFPSNQGQRKIWHFSKSSRISLFHNDVLKQKNRQEEQLKICSSCSPKHSDYKLNCQISIVSSSIASLYTCQRLDLLFFLVITLLDQNSRFSRDPYVVDGHLNKQLVPNHERDEKTTISRWEMNYLHIIE